MLLLEERLQAWVKHMQQFSAGLCPGVIRIEMGWLGERWEWEELGNDLNVAMPHDFASMVSEKPFAEMLKVSLGKHGGEPDKAGTVRWYGRERCRAVSAEHHQRSLPQQALVVGETDQDDVLVLVLAHQIHPCGLYRVAKEPFAQGVIGLEEGVYLGASVTRLLHHGLLLERMFATVSREADAFERAWQLAVEASLERVLEAQAGSWPAARMQVHLRLEEMAEEAIQKDEIVMRSSDWPEQLIKLKETAVGKALFKEPFQDQKALLERLHPCLEAGQNWEPPATITEAANLVHREQLVVPNDYVDLTCQVSRRPWFYATLKEAGHVGKRRALSIERPLYCRVARRWRLENGQVLPPLLMLGSDGVYHRLAYGAAMEPPGLYGVQMLNEDKEVVRVVFLAPSLEAMLIQAQGLVAFFEPRRQCEADQERLRAIAAEIRIKIQQVPPPSGVTAEAWAWQSSKNESALEDMLACYLNPNVWDPKALGEWCQRSQGRGPLAVEFKELLALVLDHPGLVTPAMYETWTTDSEYNTQPKLQTLLQDLWNICFPAEARHDTPVQRVWSSPRIWSAEMHQREKASYERRQARLRQSSLSRQQQQAVEDKWAEVMRKLQMANDPVLESPEWPEHVLEQTLQRLDMQL